MDWPNVASGQNRRTLSQHTIYKQHGRLDDTDLLQSLTTATTSRRKSPTGLRRVRLLRCLVGSWFHASQSITQVNRLWRLDTSCSSSIATLFINLQTTRPAAWNKSNLTSQLKSRFPHYFRKNFPWLFMTSKDHFPWLCNVTEQCTIFYIYIITSSRNITFYQLQAVHPI